MPQPSSVNNAPNDLMKLFQSSQARLEREYSAILTDETKWRRTRRLNSLRGMVDRELNALEKSAGQFSRSVIPAVYEAGAGAVACLVCLDQLSS